MIIEAFLIFSVLINIILIFYTKWVLNNYRDVVLGLENIGNLIAEYVIHLKSVYELEMFYGDETLKALMHHATALTEKLADLDLVLNEQEEEEIATDEN